MNFEEDEEEPGIKFVRLLVESDPTKDIRVLCVEEEAPPPPDAIFYRFDYDSASLIMDFPLILSDLIRIAAMQSAVFSFILYSKLFCGGGFFSKSPV